jgi:hypothetical protein
VTGTVYAPNGTLPLYDVVVYVPNATPTPLAQGVTCDQCGAVTGEPIVSALSDATGKFTLHNVPVGANIPLVIQVGKWRRQVTIPNVSACTVNKLTDPNLTRLPKNQSEGNMPHIALTTGGCDLLGCVLPKVGIDPAEFGKDGDGTAKAVHVYAGSGGQGPGNIANATVLWNDLTKLKTYDMVILSCECSESLGNKGGSGSGPPFGIMTNYMNAGGRIFTSDFMYTWYRYASDPALTAAVSLRGGAPPGGDPMSIDTTFPKGKALGDWLTATGAGGPTVSVNGTGTMFGNVISVDSTKAQNWASSGAPNAGPRVFTVNTPAGLPATKQCGKGVHLDVHVNSGANGDAVNASYPSSCSHPMLASEHLLAFFFFDLASCIQNDSLAPAPPTTVN